ncbi:MAG: LysE family transporter [Chromatiales bacterium]|nr:LysE family transporter [Chromatiales bacterium]
MTFPDIAALAAAMALLAAVPSVSVLAVSSRALAFGFWQGAATALGVVAGDLVFILLALSGLALLAETLGGLFFLVEWLAGAWLVGLGVVLWRLPLRTRRADAPADASPGSGLALGFLLTLGDQKAVLFYLGFLPAFVDLSAAGWGDAGVIALVTLLAVGGVKLGYAALAARAGRVVGARAARGMNRLAACVMIAVGGYLLLGAWPPPA